MSVPSAYDFGYGLASLLVMVVPALLGLVINVVCGIVGMNMAKSRDLRPVPGFFVGLFGSFLGLFIIALTPKKY